MINKVEIGKLLIESRERLGISRNKMAQCIGTAYGRIKIMEEGSGNYNVDSLLAYLNIIGYVLSIGQSAPVEKIKTTLHKPMKLSAIELKVEPVIKKKRIIVEEED